MGADDSTRHRGIIAAYANYFEVGHNAFEFLIDFGQVDPQSGDVNINSRVAVGPTHAKLLSNLIAGAVRQFEAEFGPIPKLRDDDPLGTVLDPTPDFERRAIDARRRPMAALGDAGSGQNTSDKSGQTNTSHKKG